MYKIIDILILVFIVFVSQVQAEQFNQNFTGQTLVVGGTGDSQTLLRNVALELEKQLKGGTIIIPDTMGSTGGIKALVAGRVDLARVARPLTSQEKERKLTYLLFAQIPVVFVVHPSVNKITNLNYQEISDIYSGKINNWSQLGDVDHKIYPLTREYGDSALKVITEFHPGFKAKEGITKTIFSTQETVKSLAKYEYTIGYLPLANVKGTQLRILQFNEVFPDVSNVKQGDYELTMPLALVYKKEPEGLARAFINFVFSPQGQKIISDFGAIPVNRAVN